MYPKTKKESLKITESTKNKKIISIYNADNLHTQFNPQIIISHIKQNIKINLNKKNMEYNQAIHCGNSIKKII